MSHFTVLVLVPQAAVPVPGEFNFDDALNDVVVDMLAPFDENEDVPEYQRECWCINSRVSNKAWEMTKAETGETIDDYRSRYAKLTDEEQEATDWKVFIKPFTDVLDRFEAELRENAKPDPECDECHGTGTYASTYNPLSKWDWYSRGGRWHGDFEERGIPTISANVAFAKDLHAANYVPFAILSPRESEDQEHDNWSEKGKMGWWAMVADEKSDWPEIAANILSKYGNHYAVLMDLHI
jgi:hypothetical protein